jgi:hypothetical protein
MSRNEDNKPFKEIYAQAVNEAMSILGEGASLVTSYLERKYSISLDDTADNPKLLSDALDSAIDGGARIVQRRILRLLYEKMNLKLPSIMLMTVNFEDKIFQAKEGYAKRVQD